MDMEFNQAPLFPAPWKAIAIKSPVLSGTRFEEMTMHGRPLFIKHEEECAPIGAPPFSKLRGVYEHIQQRPEALIGVLDTGHSKAGWAVAWSASQLHKRVINYYPKSKSDKELPFQQSQSALYGAVMVPLPPGRSSVLYHAAKSHLFKHASAYMMPNALKLKETVEQTANEVIQFTPDSLLTKECTWVISISSGTIAAGVLRGLYTKEAQCAVVLHMGYSRPHRAVMAYLSKMAGPIIPRISLVDEGWGYSERSEAIAPFPCNAFYDAKAWQWMHQQFDWPGPVIFWNIGG